MTPRNQFVACVRTMGLAGLLLGFVAAGCREGSSLPSAENVVPPENANRLIHEKSPYLLQHATNPVDWYPWGDEAFERARQEDKPIFLSIGYSTCHWCHVMEHESFEDSTVAAVMNENFVCIKVDREERPDVDEIYMMACQAMTGSGGWPLSVWLTPELKPFFAGTYFPPDDRYGRPGFKSLLHQLASAYRDRRDDVVAAAERLDGVLQQMGELPTGEGDLSQASVDTAFAQLAESFDATHGGWGAAPKFPRADYGSLALRVFHRTQDEVALQMVTTTLDRMAAGGLYDHLGGGFHRYSTDGEWLAPHFEKMLYDNAQLVFHYTEAFQAVRDPEYERVVRETIDYVLRDMTHPDGGFYSAEDADTEGEEGKFYVWTEAEIAEVLDADHLGVFAAAYDVSAAGNWEHKTILRRVRSTRDLASEFQLEPSEVDKRLSQAKAQLLERRATRTRPGLDDKVLTAWNGLMITGLSRAAIVFDEPAYATAASRAARFVLRELRDDQGLLRRWREGEARFRAYAEDYAMFVRGLLELYQATFELDFLAAARELQAEMYAEFADQDGVLFNTRDNREDLIVRVKVGYDGSVPTANSVASQNAMLLFELTGDRAFAQQAERLFAGFGATLRTRPMAIVSMLLAVDSYYGERIELVIAGDPQSEDTRRLVRAARSGYHPDLTISVAPIGSELARAVELMPPLEGKLADGPATAYVCRSFSCRLPTPDVSTMTAQLDLLRRESTEE